MAQTNVNIRMDEEIKQQADQLFSDLGMNMTTAVNVFVRQAIRTGGIPFIIKTNYPNEETMEAMQEGNEIVQGGISRFADIENMFEDLVKDQGLSTH